jgi:hypothetical protein
VNYPSDRDAWDGYLVIQVKFCQNRFDDPGKAGTWVCQQLRSDLAKFTQGSGSSRRKRPDYYLLVTNVDLTPVPKTGSLARVNEVFEESKLGLKGYDVWDGNKVRRFLDGNRDVAVAYGGYVTSGDVLATMQGFIEGLSPSFETVMADFLQAELTGPDQYARLTEAGSVAERKTALAHVFVDLPVTPHLTLDSPNERPNRRGKLPQGFAKQVVEIGGLRLDRESVLERHPSNDREPKEPTPESGRFVLIGGPGQGKTTLGQYICQLYRAAILSDRPEGLLSEGARNAIQDIVTRCHHDELELPTARRFPIRIDLRKFADELSKNKRMSVLDYISSEIDSRSGRRVDRDDLQSWLRHYPWLLVLDGLDEVPSAGNRFEVLDRIEQFTGQVATRRADLLIIATSRPQGYSSAFDSRTYCHRYLAPLSTERAMHYARGLVNIRHAEDPSLRDDILVRLQSATERPTTERLMRTPLQVTILAVLAELRGDLPDDRWQLFQEYYQTIYNRETQRQQALSSILREYEFEITQLHQRMGLRLQVLNERAGDNDAFLSHTEFEQIVADSLAPRFEEQPQQLQAILKQIKTAALERLVFLVSPQGESVGFEIRSLQEFMSARALTDGSDEDIANRLSAIAPCSYWRNVFLFAAGRCGRERRHLIQNIIGLCHTLNSDDGDVAARETLTGSRVALDLLEEDTFRFQRSHTLALCEAALRLMSLPLDEDQVRLASVGCAGHQIQSLFESQLRNNFGMSDFDRQLGAWCTCVSLIENGAGWAESIAEEYWPKDPDDQLRIMMRPIHRPGMSEWLKSRLLETAPKTAPSTIWRILQRPIREQSTTELPEWLKALDRLRRKGSQATVPIRLTGATSRSYGIRMPSIRNKHRKVWRSLLSVPEPGPPWSEVLSSARFALSSTKQTLVRELRYLADSGWSNDQHHHLLCDLAPWPFTACLKAACRGENLHDLADRAEKGDFGDRNDWRKLEDAWLSVGIADRDLLDASKHPDFGFRFAWREFSLAWSNDDDERFSPLVTALIDIYENAQLGDDRRCIAELIRDGFQMMENVRHSDETTDRLQHCPHPSFFSRWISDLGQDAWLPQLFDLIPPLPHPLEREWVDTLDRLGMRIERFHDELASEHERLAIDIAKSYREDPSRIGLMNWLTLGLNATGSMQIPPETFATTARLHPESKIAAMVLRLAHGQWSRDDAGALAKEAASTIDNDRDFNDWMMRVHVLRRFKNTEWFAPFMAQFMRRLRTMYPRIESPCVHYLKDSLSERLSSLHDPEWTELLGLN